RVRVDGEPQVVGHSAHLDPQAGLRDQVAGAVANDVDPEQLAGLAVGDDLDEALGVVDRQRPAERGERELADLELGVALGLRLVLLGRVGAISWPVTPTAGIARTSNAASWPAMISATTSPSLVALWASIMPPITSPIA